MEPLEALIAYTFRNPALLEQALTHPSLAYETQRSQVDNQRLEYLGDAVLELILSEHLFRVFPEGSEGVLTKLRARLVSRPALARCARRIHLGVYLRMGRGDEASGGRARDSTLADAFEALIAAVYLDGGLEAARDLVVALSRDVLDRLQAEPTEENPKGQLQEILQARGPGILKYVLLREDGPDHRKTFIAGVEWNGQSLGQGGGGSKKEAEAAAAEAALASAALAALGWPNAAL